MLKKINWIERNFQNDKADKLFPNIVERLRGTPARVEDKLNKLSPKDLKLRTNGKWSIQEHLGHLFDLESLWIGRLDDFSNQVDILRPADMSNKKTNEAKHNDANLSELLIKFRQVRFKMCTRLDNFSLEELRQGSMHPRLKKTMTIVDLVLFIAEHDDHHLCSIQELIIMLENK